jgi:TetR/AcrR family transcriptional regulator
MPDATKQRIVAAALSLFAERGFDAVSLRDIAGRAHVTHGLLRHHFGGKDGVWRAVVSAADRAFGQPMSPVVNRILAATHDPVDDVEAFIAALATASARNPEFVKLLLAESISDGPRLPQITQELRPLREATTTVLARLHERGHLHQFDAPGFVLFLLLATAGPYALSALAQRLAAADGTAPRPPHEHARQISATLFGSSTS